MLHPQLFFAKIKIFFGKIKYIIQNIKGCLFHTYDFRERFYKSIIFSTVFLPRDEGKTKEILV